MLFWVCLISLHFSLSALIKPQKIQPMYMFMYMCEKCTDYFVEHKIEENTLPK